MAAAQQVQNLCGPFGIIALALCVLSLCTVQANCQHSFPSEHGVMYAKNPGEASSPEMIAFFGQPTTDQVELPEGRNVSDPVWRAAAKTVPPADHPVHNGGPAIVFAVLGTGLLVTALVAAAAYMLHARRSRAWSLVGLTRGRRNDPAVQLGAV